MDELSEHRVINLLWEIYNLILDTSARQVSRLTIGEAGPSQSTADGPHGTGRERVFIYPRPILPPMTALSFDEHGVDVVYQGTDFRLEKDLIEEAIGKSYPNVTDHEVLKIVEKEPALSGEPRRIQDILRT
jgi:hypothetical protein